MGSCCAGTDRFFSRSASKYRKRFTKKGFEASQRNLFDHLLAQASDSIEGASVMEIGCGVGYFHQRLLRAGAGSAVGVDVATEMLREAKLLADELGTADKSTYVMGDYVDLADANEISEADITVLDKVVCCYADADGLLSRAANNTGEILAMTFPRGQTFVRFGIHAMKSVSSVLRWQFHPFAHAPEYLASIMQKAGFERVATSHTLIWQSEIYRRCRSSQV